MDEECRNEDDVALMLRFEQKPHVDNSVCNGFKAVGEAQTEMSVCGGLPVSLQSVSGDNIHPSSIPI